MYQNRNTQVKCNYHKIVLLQCLSTCTQLHSITVFDPGDPLKFSDLHDLLAQCMQSSLPVLLPSSTFLFPPGGLQPILLAGDLHVALFCTDKIYCIDDIPHLLLFLTITFFSG